MYSHICWLQRSTIKEKNHEFQNYFYSESESTTDTARFHLSWRVRLSSTSQYPSLGWLYTYCKIHENDREMQKQKIYSRVFRITFFVLCPFLRFSHFVTGLAFAWKVKGFRCSSFRCIKKTRILHEIRKVHSECFVFCGVFCKMQNMKSV